MTVQRIVAPAIGTPIRLALIDDGQVHNPTGASLREITLWRADGTSVTKSGAQVTVGELEDGRACLETIVEPGDITQPPGEWGEYTAIGYIEDTAGKWEAEPGTFKVYRSRRGS